MSIARLIVFVLLLVTMEAHQRAQADALVIHIGWAQAPGHLAPLFDVLAKKHPEIMPHQGQSYDAAAIHFGGSTPQIQAMAAGELEIAAFAPSSLTLAIANAGLNVRIVSDVIQDGLPGYYDEPFIVKKDGPIKTVDDIKGKRIATNAIGSASDNAMRMELRRHGIADKDFTTVEADFANMVPMIEADKVDLAALMPQFIHRVDALGTYRTLYTASKARGGPAQTVFWVTSASFIAAHRAVLVDFFEDHIRAVRWFLDAKNRSEALAIAMQVTKQPQADLDYAFTNADFYRSPDMVPNIAAAQHEIDESTKLGLLPKAVTLSPNYVDLSMVEEAKARIDHAK
jgi:ABC-type nitrate/sulfonate/bicarbonate transport system substrate-binding protein